MVMEEGEMPGRLPLAQAGDSTLVRWLAIEECISPGSIQYRSLHRRWIIILLSTMHVTYKIGLLDPFVVARPDLFRLRFD